MYNLTLLSVDQSIRSNTRKYYTSMHYDMENLARAIAANSARTYISDSAVDVNSLLLILPTQQRM